MTMIRRYTTPRSGRSGASSATTRPGSRSDFAAAAMAEAGLVPADAARELREKAGFDVARIEAIEAITHRDVIAFTTAVAQRWARRAMAPFRPDLVRRRRHRAVAADAAGVRPHRSAAYPALMDAVRVRAEEHRNADDRPHARRARRADDVRIEALALWYTELQRDLDRLLRARDVVAVGKFGCGRHLRAISIRRSRHGCARHSACRRRRYRPGHSARSARRTVHRAGDYRCVAREFALEIRGLQKTEIGEVEEPFAKGRRARRRCRTSGIRSGASRYRARPADSRQRDGGLRGCRALARAGHLALVGRARDPARHLHRARSHAAALHADRRGMVVYPDRMLQNLDRSRGVVSRHGAARARASRHLAGAAYGWVQRNAMRSFHEQKDFKALLLADDDLVKVLPPADIEKSFDLDDQLRDVDAIFARVLRSGAPDLFVTLKPSVFDPRAARSSRRCARSATRVGDIRPGSTSSSRSMPPPPTRPRARGHRRRQSARQPGNRELCGSKSSSG